MLIPGISSTKHAESPVPSTPRPNHAKLEDRPVGRDGYRVFYYNDIRLDKRGEIVIAVEGMEQVEQVLRRRKIINDSGRQGGILRKAVRAMQNAIALDGNAEVNIQAFPVLYKHAEGDDAQLGVLIVGRDAHGPEDSRRVFCLTPGYGLSVLDATWVREEVENDDFCVSFM
jgi:hypothetical protein